MAGRAGAACEDEAPPGVPAGAEPSWREEPAPPLRRPMARARGDRLRRPMKRRPAIDKYGRPAGAAQGYQSLVKWGGLKCPGTSPLLGVRGFESRPLHHLARRQPGPRPAPRGAMPLYRARSAAP